MLYVREYNRSDSSFSSEINMRRSVTTFDIQHPFNREQSCRLREGVEAVESKQLARIAATSLFRLVSKTVERYCFAAVSKLMRFETVGRADSTLA